MLSSVRAVTVSVSSLTRARALYEGLLGMQPLAGWRSAGGAGADALARLLGCEREQPFEAVWLEQPGAATGALRLVRFGDGTAARAVDGARPWDHGYVKNLDFFTDDVEGAYARCVAAGHAFLAPPLSYRVPWGEQALAHEAHLPTEDGVKLTLARMGGAPRTAYGESSRETGFTEIAAATHVVADFERATRFFVEAFDCVPAAETVVDDPQLVTALRLPAATRLRLAFIGPPDAIGGKIGVVAYEGDGVRNGRSLAARARPPLRGALSLSFTTDAVDTAHGRALVCGASEVAAPNELELPPFGRVRASSIRSPDGVLIELLEATATGGDEVRVLEEAALPEGALQRVPLPGRPAIALANVAGHVFALEDRCPHLGGPLGHGALRGRQAVCPWHGWSVDVTTGRVAGGQGRAVASYRVRRHDGGIWVRLPGSGRVPPA